MAGVVDRVACMVLSFKSLYRMFIFVFKQDLVLYFLNFNSLLLSHRVFQDQGGTSLLRFCEFLKHCHF